ncbi:MAG: transcriptional repressor [Spirochaetes bacterium GWD1_27_9]|nr:MAG: transcriptional repressor [Spirochaetes bacterium GWB1_27_13]OHD24041.1 MAG: transcriptional repressor [Spirochaetes bacterium GWC1_27_15]OHD30681.1 MAG: transcriptional repressor [Spirochaetes bacterium GWD1_27_9]
MFEKEFDLLEEYITTHNLKHSSQRNDILKNFLKEARHLTVEELYNILKEKGFNIGIATVYRTLKLFSEIGISKELKFEDGISRYESNFGISHHDHLICLKCGKIIEIESDEIENLQQKISLEHNFILKSHKLELYGFCKECQ